MTRGMIPTTVASKVKANLAVKSTIQKRKKRVQMKANQKKRKKVSYPCGKVENVVLKAKE